MSEYDLSPLIDRLNGLKDAQYAAFNAGVVPGLQYDMLGVRMPMLHAIAKEIIRLSDWRGFLDASRGHSIYEVRMLHAMVLGFHHPRTGEYMEFTAPLPAYFSKLLETFTKQE